VIEEAVIHRHIEATAGLGIEETIETILFHGD
jgi:hypothetical protein